jgi:hydrogenase maturation protein HypF
MVPDPLSLPHDRTLLTFGAERNVTVSVARSGKMFTSPYVGNSRHPQVLDFAATSAKRFMYLFGADDIEAVIIDKHPRYATRYLGREISEKERVPLIEVQHHHAHAASLMVDAEVQALTTVVVDGVGYGDDALPWGGEILRTEGASMERLGHLEEFGLPGGDASVYHPERIAHWLSKNAGKVLDIGDERLMDLLVKTHLKATMTTSLGRVLDALSALMLGITWRTYDGEPAMRLEKLLSSSRNPLTHAFSIPVRGGAISVKERWKRLLDIIQESSDGDLVPGVDLDYRTKADLAMGFVSSIIDDMVSVSLKAGYPEDGEGRPLIGLSGGVAYDVPIVKRFVKGCRESGAVPVLHSRVPPGDGGISVGQAFVGGLSL